MRRLPSGAHVHEIRRKHLGRWSFALSDDARIAKRQRDALNALADAKESSVLDRVTARELTLDQVVEALRPGGSGIESLRPKVEGVTLQRACNALWSEALGQRRRQRTLQIIDLAAQQLMKEFGANAIVADLPADRIAEWFYSRGWGAATQVQKRTYFRAIFEKARKLEEADARRVGKRSRFDVNVWDDIAVARAKRPAWRPFLDVAETHAMLDKLNIFHQAWLGCGFLGMLRIDEASHLRWEDVDFERGVLYIRPHEAPVAWDGPKSERGVREVQMPERLANILQRARDCDLPGDYIFGGKQPLPSWRAKEWTQFAFKHASMVYGRGTGWTYHDGRHSAISNALRAGVPVEIVARQAGDTVKALMDSYSHIKPEDPHLVARVFDLPSRESSSVKVRHAGDRRG